jgi:TrbL/VirB6 plasmid conjugal transfer protein
MKRTLSLIALLPVTAAAQIQGPIPINSTVIDLTSFVTTALDQLVNTYSGLFVALVTPWVRNGLLIALVFAGLAWMFDNANAGLKLLFRALMTYAVVHFLLTYYDNPLPVIGIPFSQIFRMEGRYLSGVIDISLLNVFTQRISDLFAQSDKPDAWNIFQTIAYYLVMMAMALPEIALFVETATAIIALGIGALLGSIFVALFMFPFAWCKNLFWAWVHYMLKYMLYRVFASALVFIWATAEMAFIANVFSGFSLGAFTAKLLGLLVFNVSCAIVCFRIGHFVSDMTTGNASGGSGGLGTAVAIGARFI